LNKLRLHEFFGEASGIELKALGKRFFNILLMSIHFTKIVPLSQ